MECDVTAGTVVEVLTGRIVRHGVPLKVPCRPLELCMALAVARGRMGVARLSDLLFPDLDTITAANRVRVYASRLRGFVPELVERVERFGYRLSSAVSVDLDEIEQIVRNARRAHAADPVPIIDALARLHSVRDKYPHNRWAWFESVEARIADLANDAIAEFARTTLADEDPVAIEIARGALRCDPLDEVATALMMRALLRIGRRSEALRVFGTYVERMRSELHAEPAPELCAIVSEALGK